MTDHPLRARRTLGAQIAEVRREIAMRHKVYPGLINKRRMKQGEADELILLMENVLATLIEKQDEISASEGGPRVILT